MDVEDLIDHPHGAPFPSEEGKIFEAVAGMVLHMLIRLRRLCTERVQQQNACCGMSIHSSKATLKAAHA